MNRTVRRRATGFGLIEAVVVLFLLFLGVGMLGPMLTSRHCGHNRPIQNSIQSRGIHQAMVTYAQGNKIGGTEGWFPGLNPDGTDAELSPGGRLALLLDGNYFTPEYAISPNDNDPTLQPWSGSGPVTGSNISYAMLQLPPTGARRSEWRETLHTKAVVLTDRNTGTVFNPTSLWGGPREPWSGTVTRNDNSTGFETRLVLDLEYDGIATQGDRLFHSISHDDGYLIHGSN